MREAVAKHHKRNGARFGGTTPGVAKAMANCQLTVIDGVTIATCAMIATRLAMAFDPVHDSGISMISRTLCRADEPVLVV